jgi:carbon monoxide dehydrogenase subunit G
MEFTNTFDVAAPLATVWDFMLNAREVAPCVPGASITEEIDAHHFKGAFKVKLGAVQISYKGELEMEPDEATHTVVLRAKGTELRGSGGASGVVTTTLTEQDERTHVEILSHIDVSGKAAQFGRSIMPDVANKLIRDFAACLERKLQSSDSPGEPAVTPAASSESQRAHSAAATEDSGKATSPSTSVEPVAPAATAPTPRPPVTPTVNEPTELKLSTLLLEILRARLAAGLRYVAKRIDPQP